jgi:hypothetical protein
MDDIYLYLYIYYILTSNTLCSFSTIPSRYFLLLRFSMFDGVM